MCACDSYFLILSLSLHSTFSRRDEKHKHGSTTFRSPLKKPRADRRTNAELSKRRTRAEFSSSAVCRLAARIDGTGCDPCFRLNPRVDDKNETISIAASARLQRVRNFVIDQPFARSAIVQSVAESLSSASAVTRSWRLLADGRSSLFLLVFTAAT